MQVWVELRLAFIFTVALYQWLVRHIELSSWESLLLACHIFLVAYHLGIPLQILSKLRHLLLRHGYLLLIDLIRLCKFVEIDGSAAESEVVATREHVLTGLRSCRLGL